MNHPTIIKRLLAAFYDSLLILASLFFATLLTLPFTKGEIAAENNIYMSFYLFAVIIIFYGWFWTHGGQTLGMRTWKQQLISINGKPVSWQQSSLRVLSGAPAWILFLISLLLWMFPEKTHITKYLANIPAWLMVVVSFIWILLDNRSGNWRDKITGTQIVSTDK